MSNYVIGIDGGGTKTLGVLWNNKQEVKRVTKGFANFNVDLEKSKLNIENTIDELIIETNKTPIIIIGVSGFSGLKDPKIYEKYLSEKYKTKVIIKDDGFLALNSVDNNDNLPVILTISGTGSIIYGLNNLDYYRYGGHGHLLGDEGSSYDVSINAFKLIINEFDNDKGLSDFSKDFLERTQIKSVDEIKQLVYHNSKNEIAKYSKVVDQLATKHNTALILIMKVAFDLYEQINKLLLKMSVDDKFILSLRGGLIVNSKIAREKLINLLENNNMKFIVDLNDNEPVYGALKVAEDYK